MSSRIIVLRTVIRAILALILIIALLSSLFFLLTELNASNPNPALTALLGTIIGAMGGALTALVNAIGSNPSDRTGNQE